MLEGGSFYGLFMYNLLSMKWFPDEIDGDVYQEQDEEEHVVHAILRTRSDWDKDLELDAALGSGDQVDMPERLYSLIDWISGPGYLLINPMFLKMYKVIGYRSRFKPETLMMIGVVLSVIVNFGLAIKEGSSKCAIPASQFATALVAVILIYALFRMLIIALIVTPRAISNEVERGVIHSVFSTPLSDDEIFYGSSMAHLLKAYPIIEETFSFIISYMSIFTIVMGPVGLYHLVFGREAPMAWVTIALLVTVTGLIFTPLISLLASRTAGLYSLQVSWLSVLFLGLLHMLAVGLFAWGMGELVYWLIGMIPKMNPKLFALIGPFFTYIMVMSSVWWGSAITGFLGVWVLGRYRRKTVGWW